MSSSPETPETALKFPARKPSGRAPEKSSFAQTCSLLSQYLKEKGSFGDLSREVTGILETKGRSEMTRPAEAATTMNLLTSIDRTAGEDSSPQFAAGNRSSDPVEDAVNGSDLGASATTRTTELESAQMTIFYAGEVMVYNDLQVDKAREIMALASKGSRSSQYPNTHSASTPGTKFSPCLDSSSNSGSNVAAAPSKECPPKPAQAAAPADMPIKRRNSLHRFLEKRKERSTATAPYPVISKHFPAPGKAKESKPTVDTEAQPSESLELKL